MQGILSILLTVICSGLLSGQQTVGLLSYQKDKSFGGYNLLYPHNQPNVYLLNACGEIVHVWPDSSVWRPGNTAYLTPDGKLIKTKRSKNVSGNPIWFGGGGAIVEIRDWNNKLEWRFERNDTLERLHHDIRPMPNGNILMNVWVKKTKEEMAAAGRDTVRFKEAVLLTESIIEVDPKSNAIVWRWNLWDHMIQDVDTSRPNFGDVATNAGKVDINYPYFTDGSWYHMNAIDYDEELDQILVSIPTHNEIWILDHSTTTAQAATNKGGLSGVGGDLMYRWGNPATYRKGTADNKRIGYQHGVHWVRQFIPLSNGNYGKINIFNNRAGNNFSEVQLLSPPWDMYEWKYKKTGGIWGPEQADQVVRHPDKEKLFSDILSNAQYLPNGNMLILSGRTGYLFELTPDGKIVWEYKVPLKNGARVEQGTGLVINDNTTFRVIRYPEDYSAFQGKDLSAKGLLETNGNPDFCKSISSVPDNVNPGVVQMFPNPASHDIRIEALTKTSARIISRDGSLEEQVILEPGINTLDVSSYPEGLYFLYVENEIARAFVVER